MCGTIDTMSDKETNDDKAKSSNTKFNLANPDFTLL